jgi:hypothetical protein
VIVLTDGEDSDAAMAVVDRFTGALARLSVATRPISLPRGESNARAKHES